MIIKIKKGKSREVKCLFRIFSAFLATNEQKCCFSSMVSSIHRARLLQNDSFLLDFVCNSCGKWRENKTDYLGLVKKIEMNLERNKMTRVTRDTTSRLHRTVFFSPSNFIETLIKKTNVNQGSFLIWERD